MSKQLSRRQRAVEQLQIAKQGITKAQSLLGGKPRGWLPSKNKGLFHARQLIASLDNRLELILEYLAGREAIEQPAYPTRAVPDLRDDFEREYDRERKPQC